MQLNVHDRLDVENRAQLLIEKVLESYERWQIHCEDTLFKEDMVCVLGMQELERLPDIYKGQVTGFVAALIARVEGMI